MPHPHPSPLTCRKAALRFAMSGSGKSFIDDFPVFRGIASSRCARFAMTGGTVSI
jgi:hypothetical protein